MLNPKIPNALRKFNVENKNQGAGKCLEAPHLDTVGTILCVAGIKARSLEKQVHTIGATD